MYKNVHLYLTAGLHMYKNVHLYLTAGLHMYKNVHLYSTAVLHMYKNVFTILILFKWSRRCVYNQYLKQLYIYIYIDKTQQV